MKKYVLIISDEDDGTTNTVIDWLVHFNTPFVRINGTSLLRLISLKIDNDSVDFEIEVYEKTFNSYRMIKYNEILSVWYRRGYLNFDFSEILSSNISLYLKKYLTHERQKLTDFFNFIFTNKFSFINSFNDNSINKISALVIACECGLSIPETLVCSNSKTLFDLNLSYSLISKSIDTSYIDDIPYRHFGYTSAVDQISLGKYHHFFPSLFQRNIKKKYELRIFYLLGNLYASAILSQNDEQTQIDYRNYNYNKQNRVVPFSLPEEIRYKLTLTMRNLNLNCGSIDMIVTTDDHFVFLEVNPIGQFQQVSYPCSFYLERELAKHLIHKTIH